MSIALEIATALSARIEAISVANGYMTDIGLRVFRGRREISVDKIPCVVLIEDDDSAEPQGSTKHSRNTCDVTAPYVFEAHLYCDPDHPNDAAHQAIADLKKALFRIDDHDYGGLLSAGLAYRGRTIEPREPGVSAVAVAVRVEASYIESLENP